MGIIDAVILLMLGLGGVIGFKRGIFKQTVITVGTIIVLILAFTLKNPVSVFLYEHFPFFNFNGIFSGVTSLNILVYEMIAFSIVAALLSIVLRIIAWGAGILEKALAFTIILAIPSKILGAILGVIEAYILIFMALFILTLPVFNIGIVNESHWKDKILTSSPIITKYADKTVDTFDEIYSLKNKFKDSTNSNELNKQVLDVMLKNKIVTVKSVDKLIELKKINITGIDSVLNKYR